MKIVTPKTFLPYNLNLNNNILPNNTLIYIVNNNILTVFNYGKKR